MPDRMRDLDRFNLSGPVRAVITERRLDTGVLLKIGEVTFDEAGNIVGRLDAAVQIERHAEGGLTEVQDVRDSALWSMRGLQGVGFATHGAAAARTAFDARGVPIATAFVDAGASVLSQLRYLCDGGGAILEAIQYAGKEVPSWANEFLDDVRVRAHVEEGHEQAHAIFEYDAAGRLTSTRIYVLDQLIHNERRTYNERGDLDTLTTDETDEIRYAYRYDRWNNWIHRMCYHARGVHEELRTLSYYVE